MITFAVDDAARVRTATYAGAVDDVGLLDAYRRLLADPGYDPALNNLVDLCGLDLERAHVSAEGVRRVAALLSGAGPRAPRGRAAIAAPADLPYGMARMFQQIRDPVMGGRVAVFRDLAEARRWLGLPEAEQVCPEMLADQVSFQAAHAHLEAPAGQ